MQLAGEFFAVAAAFAKLLKADGGADSFFAQQIDKVRDEGHIFPITDFLADISVFELILNQAREQRMSLPRGGFEQRRLEGQYGLAIGTCSFWKQDDEGALIEGRLNFIRGLADT